MARVSYPQRLVIGENQYCAKASPEMFATARYSKQEDKTIDKNIIKFPHGSANWISCREELMDSFELSENNKILFSHPSNKGIKIAQFLRAAEKKLKLEQYSKVIGFKKEKNMSLIEYSPWWAKNDARWQLFTILLRCGIRYNTSFDKALYKHEYIEATKTAVQKFFEGYTNFNESMDGNRGWVAIFDEEGEYSNDYDGEPQSYRELQKNWSKLKKPRKK